MILINLAKSRLKVVSVYYATDAKLAIFPIIVLAPVCTIIAFHFPFIHLVPKNI